MAKPAVGPGGLRRAVGFVHLLKRVPAAFPRGRKSSGPPRSFLPHLPVPPLPLPRGLLPPGHGLESCLE